MSRMRDHLVVFQIEVISKSEFSKNLFCFLRNIFFKIYAMWPLLINEEWLTLVV